MSEAFLTPVDVNAWVESVADNTAEYMIRRVMRIALFAVADSPLLKSRMVIKGGVLLALGYGTDRHTRDLDFSIARKVQQQDTQEILDELGRSLAEASRHLEEPILCRVQSYKMEPPRSDASFPTMRVRVGYAVEGGKQHRRMVQGRDSSDTLILDLSFNEKTCIASAIALDGQELAAYSLFDQIAEKYRAIIQQVGGRRNRLRRQDTYDVYSVVAKGYLSTQEDKATLLAVMREKFAARDVPCQKHTINEPEIKQRSRKEYHRLQEEIDGELPDFEEAFETVRDFYLSLPWD